MSTELRAVLATAAEPPRGRQHAGKCRRGRTCCTRRAQNTNLVQDGLGYLPTCFVAVRQGSPAFLVSKVDTAATVAPLPHQNSAFLLLYTMRSKQRSIFPSDCYTKLCVSVEFQTDIKGIPSLLENPGQTQKKPIQHFPVPEGEAVLAPHR